MMWGTRVRANYVLNLVILYYTILLYYNTLRVVGENIDYKDSIAR